jgi:hypothetical protein
MFEVRIDPEVFKDGAAGGKLQSTLGNSCWPRNIRFEPSITDNVVEWWTTKSRCVVLHALLLRSWPDSSAIDAWYQQVIQARTASAHFVQSVFDSSVIRLPSSWGEGSAVDGSKCAYSKGDVVYTNTGIRGKIAKVDHATRTYSVQLITGGRLLCNTPEGDLSTKNPGLSIISAFGPSVPAGS